MRNRPTTRGFPRTQSATISGLSAPVTRLLQAPGAAFAFATALLRDPRSVGAVVPASRWLAEAMGRQLDGCGCEVLLEVGPGTGAITRVLDARRCAFSRVVALERDQWMAEVLQERFPDIEVVNGCATELVRHVRSAGPVAIVSSLPFRSLPQDVVMGCVQALTDTLDSHPGSLLLQYTYGRTPPFASPAPRFVWTRVAQVARNLPPATIWRLERADLKAR